MLYVTFGNGVGMFLCVYSWIKYSGDCCLRSVKGFKWDKTHFPNGAIHNYKTKDGKNINCASFKVDFLFSLTFMYTWYMSKLSSG